MLSQRYESHVAVVCLQSENDVVNQELRVGKIDFSRDSILPTVIISLLLLLTRVIE